MPNTPTPSPTAADVGAILARIRELDKAATPGGTIYFLGTEWTRYQFSDDWYGGWRDEASQWIRRVATKQEAAMLDRIAEYRTLAVQLAAHVEALQADSRRVEWLEREGAGIDYPSRFGGGGVAVSWGGPQPRVRTAPTIRAAVDKAMSTSEGRADGE